VKLCAGGELICGSNKVVIIKITMPTCNTVYTTYKYMTFPDCHLVPLHIYVLHVKMLCINKVAVLSIVE